MDKRKGKKKGEVIELYKLENRKMEARRKFLRRLPLIISATKNCEESGRFFCPLTSQIESSRVGNGEPIQGLGMGS